MKRVPLLTALVLLFAGCMSTGDENPTPGLASQAEAFVVMSDAPTGEADAWELSGERIQTIGREDGDPDYLLHRVFSACMLDDGAIAVSNSGTSEVRIYDAQGMLVRRFGSEGQGPGEFGEFASMYMHRLGADSIGVMDERHRRLHVFGSDGGYGRSVMLDAFDGFDGPSIVGVFSSGDLLGSAPEGSRALDGEVGDRIDMRFGYFRYSPAGTDPVLLTTRDGSPRIVNRIGDGGRHFPFVPLTPSPVIAVDGDDFLVASGQEPEFQRLDREGNVAALVRWNQQRTPVAEIWPRFSDEYAADIADRQRREAYERLLARSDLPMPDEVPAVEGMLVDALGYVWVQQYRLPWELASTWQVLDRNGVWVGSLVTPAGLSVLEIGEDYVLGRDVDEAGVERVVVYGLERGEGRST